MSFTGHRKQEVLDAVNAATDAVERFLPEDLAAKQTACIAIAAFARSMHESECTRYGRVAYDVMAEDIEGLA